MKCGSLNDLASPFPFCIRPVPSSVLDAYTQVVKASRSCAALLVAVLDVSARDSPAMKTRMRDDRL
jgi:hypothetical protein